MNLRNYAIVAQSRYANKMALKGAPYLELRREMYQKTCYLARKRGSLNLILLISSATFAHSTYANQDFLAMSLEELLQERVVTAASGFEQPLDKAPASVTVVTRDEWRSMGATALVDVLATVPGMHIGLNRTGITQNIPMIRGVSGSRGQQVLLLIDGKPYRHLQNNGRFINQRIALDSYERIEIVRGPSSAIYGADAIGGVINLVTGNYGHNSLSANTGSFDSHELAWRHRIDNKALSAQWALQYQTSSSDPNAVVDHDLQSSFDQSFGTNASQAPGHFDVGYKLMDANARVEAYKFWAAMHYSEMSDMGLGAGVAQALDPNGKVEYRNERYTAGYTLVDTQRHQLKADISYNYQNVSTYLHVFPENTQLPIGNDGNIDFVNPAGIVTFTDGYIGTPTSKSASTSASMEHIINLTHHTLRWELGYEKQRFTTREKKNFGPGIINGTEGTVDGLLTDVSGTPFIYMPNVSRELGFFSIQDQWEIAEDWTAVAGVRFDNYSDFGSTTNPRINISWQATPKLRLQSFAGSAFRPPAFVELYSQNNPAAVGNANLKPEKSQTYELGLSAHIEASDNLIFDSTFYHFEINEIIEFITEPDSGVQVAENFGEQTGRGMEIEATWRLQSQLDLKAHVAYNRVEDVNNNTVVGVPEKMAFIQAHWKAKQHWHTYLSSKWIGERSRAVGDTRNAIDDYVWTNARIAYQRKDIEIALHVNNLLDVDAREPSNGAIPNDYPLQGRKFMLQFSMTY